MKPLIHGAWFPASTHCCSSPLATDAVIWPELRFCALYLGDYAAGGRAEPYVEDGPDWDLGTCFQTEQTMNGLWNMLSNPLIVWTLFELEFTYSEWFFFFKGPVALWLCSFFFEHLLLTLSPRTSQFRGWQCVCDDGCEPRSQLAKLS